MRWVALLGLCLLHHEMACSESDAFEMPTELLASGAPGNVD